VADTLSRIVIVMIERVLRTVCSSKGMTIAQIERGMIPSPTMHDGGSTISA
jgi:hypothetical protein